MVMISTIVDGVSHAEEVEPRLLLVHYLRRRIVIMTAPVPQGTVPPTRAMP